MNKSCHTSEWVMSRTWTRHFTRMNTSCHTLNEPCHAYEWVMSHVWMSHVTHLNESCHASERAISQYLTRHYPRPTKRVLNIILREYSAVCVWNRGRERTCVWERVTWEWVTSPFSPLSSRPGRDSISVGSVCVKQRERENVRERESHMRVSHVPLHYSGRCARHARSPSFFLSLSLSRTHCPMRHCHHLPGRLKVHRITGSIEISVAFECAPRILTFDLVHFGGVAFSVDTVRSHSAVSLPSGRLKVCRITGSIEISVEFECVPRNLTFSIWCILGV